MLLAPGTIKLQPGANMNLRLCQRQDGAALPTRQGVVRPGELLKLLHTVVVAGDTTVRNFNVARKITDLKLLLDLRLGKRKH